MGKRAAHPGDKSKGTDAFVVAEFDRATGRHATLFFGLDTMDGTALESSPATSMLGALRNRLSIFWTPLDQLGRRLASRYVAMPLCYQLQLIVETDASLSPAELAEARACFEEARQGIRRKAARQAGHATASTIK